MSEIAWRSARGVRSIVIVGGGTAGWMAAAALARVLTGTPCTIAVAESGMPAAAGVGEGTIPNLREFHGFLELDERDFLNAAHATFKLGTRFRDWGTIGRRFLHPFGPYGVDVQHELFQAQWLKRQKAGHPSPLEEWSVTGLAATLGRFAERPVKEPSPLRHLSHAYHLDEALYATFLRSYAEKRGVVRLSGEVIDATLDGRGLIESVRLRDGRCISGDFFIDCSEAGLLIEGRLNSGFRDWARWLPCDRAVAIPCARSGDPAVITESTARRCGWQWRIPLRHRIGNGYVYSSAHLCDDEAAARLLESLESPPLADPRLLRFKAGCRARAWVGNCLALGPAAVSLEPLESTGFHLTQTGLGRLFPLFPDRDFDPAVTAEYNRLTALEHEHVRDFLILHYVASKRDDSLFWRDCRAMSPPRTLAYKRDLFTKTGRIAMLEEETFAAASWLAIYAGLEVWPERHEPSVDILGSSAISERFEVMRGIIRTAVEALPRSA
ncbi:MAG TPA: tryptophan halogenase family protein [Steroidobacteraceae bacterium]